MFLLLSYLISLSKNKILFLHSLLHISPFLFPFLFKKNLPSYGALISSAYNLFLRMNETSEIIDLSGLSGIAILESIERLIN